jgi:putative redox protein
MAAMEVELRWQGEGLRFESGVPGGGLIDGDAEAGPSPMQSLLLGLAGCMAVDVIMILQKMRVPLEGLTVRVAGERAPEPPRRFTSIDLIYETRGLAPEDGEKLDRAIALSREKYCSVLHTLRPDLAVSIETALG